MEVDAGGKRRKITNPRSNWTRVETEEFVHLKDRFEKPTAQLFYTQLAAKEQSLACFSWKAMRDKMKNMKNKYKAAIAWRNNTGAGLDAEDKEQTIRDYILKLCPQFDMLEELFGERPSIHPLFIADSDDSASTNTDIWLDVEVTTSPVGDGEGNGSDNISPPLMSPTSPIPATSQPLYNQQATPAQPSPPRDSFSTFQRQMAKKPSSKQPTKLSSSLAHLNQINLDRLEVMKYKADKEAEAEDKRIQLEREKFQWQQQREEKMLELDEKRMLEETKLKQEELRNKFLLEKFRIEKEFELKKTERQECEEKQD